MYCNIHGKPLIYQCSACGKQFCQDCIRNCPVVDGKYKCNNCRGELGRLPDGQQYYTPQQNTYQQQQPPVTVIINNDNKSTNVNSNINGGYGGRAKNKWVALILCIFLGIIGAHKFYEGKFGMGILYMLTCGLCGVGIIIDIIAILSHPAIYYV